MEKRSTVLTIVIATILALGLTIYGENVDSRDIQKTKIVESHVSHDYKKIYGEVRD